MLSTATSARSFNGQQPDGERVAHGAQSESNRRTPACGKSVAATAADRGADQRQQQQQQQQRRRRRGIPERSASAVTDKSSSSSSGSTTKDRESTDSFTHFCFIKKKLNEVKCVRRDPICHVFNHRIIFKSAVSNYSRF